MEKINLTDEAKVILKLVDLELYESPRNKSEEKQVALLDYEGLVESVVTKDSVFNYDNLEITTKGLAYLATNPKLKNISILDDPKFAISTAISALKLFF